MKIINWEFSKMIKYRCGFTLIEVLIALLIVSLALFASIFTLTELTKSAIQLKEKTIASTIASNVISQARLGMLNITDKSLQGNNITMAHQTWTWELTKEQTPDQHVAEIIVVVKNVQSKREYQMKGYMSANHS